MKRQNNLNLAQTKRLTLIKRAEKMKFPASVPIFLHIENVLQL